MVEKNKELNCVCVCFCYLIGRCSWKLNDLSKWQKYTYMEILEKLIHEKIYVALNKSEILHIMIHTKLGIFSW